MKKKVLNNGSYDIYINENEVIREVNKEVNKDIDRKFNDIDKEVGFVIACHGLKSSKDMEVFNVLSECLGKKNIGFISFDFPGHGDSKVSGEYLNEENSLKDIDCVFQYGIKKYGGKAGFIGTSYGSEMIWKYTKLKEGSNLISSLVLMNTAVTHKYVIEYFLNGRVEEILEKGYAVIGNKDPLVITKDYYEGLVNEEVYKNDVDPLVKKIFIHGDADKMAPIEYVRELSSKLDSKLYEFEKEGHVFGEEASKKAANIACEFLSEEVGRNYELPKRLWCIIHLFL